MTVIDSLFIPGEFPSGKRRVAEECLKEICLGDSWLKQEIWVMAVDPEHAPSGAIGYAQYILAKLRRVERLIPQLITADFIESWLTETEHRLKPFGVPGPHTPKFAPTHVSGLALGQYAAQYADPGELTRLRSDFVKHLHEIGESHYLAPTADSYLKLAQLWIEIECVDRHLNQMAGGGLGAGSFTGLLFRPSRASGSEAPWHTPWSAEGQWDVLVADERAEAAYDLIVEMLVGAPERASRGLLALMEHAVNGDPAAWDRLRAACGVDGHAEGPSLLPEDTCGDGPVKQPSDADTSNDAGVAPAGGTPHLGSASAADDLRYRLRVATHQLREEHARKRTGQKTVTRTELFKQVGKDRSYLTERAKDLGVDVRPYLLLYGPPVFDPRLVVEST